MRTVHRRFQKPLILTLMNSLWSLILCPCPSPPPPPFVLIRNRLWLLTTISVTCSYEKINVYHTRCTLVHFDDPYVTELYCTSTSAHLLLFQRPQYVSPKLRISLFDDRKKLAFKLTLLLSKCTFNILHYVSLRLMGNDSIGVTVVKLSESCYDPGPKETVPILG